MLSSQWQMFMVGVVLSEENTPVTESLAMIVLALEQRTQLENFCSWKSLHILFMQNINITTQFDLSIRNIKKRNTQEKLQSFSKKQAESQS